MHFFPIDVIPLSYQIVDTIFHTGSCTANYTNCCISTRNCEVEGCYCDSDCYKPENNDCCSDLPQICPPRK